MLKVEAQVEIYKEDGVDISGSEKFVIVRSCGPYSDFIELCIEGTSYHIVSAELSAAIGRCSKI